MSLEFTTRKQGSDLTASAGTLTVPNDAESFNFSGNVSTVATGARLNGRLIWLRATDSATITHDASDLILSDGADLAVEAGQELLFRVIGTNQVRQVALGDSITYATQEQAEAGEAEDVVMNPLTTKQAIAALAVGGLAVYSAEDTDLEDGASITVVHPADGDNKRIARLLVTETSSDSIVPTMTANNEPEGYVASANAEQSYGGGYFYAFGVFTTGNNNGAYSFWSPSPTALPGWVQIQLPVAKTVANYDIVARTDNADTSDAPKTWTLQGSNDGVVWTDIDTVSGETGWSQGQSRHYVVDNPGSYIYYHLYITDTQSSTVCSVGDWKLYDAGQTVVRTDGIEIVFDSDTTTIITNSTGSTLNATAQVLL
jgi:hypothetical protein